MAISISKLCVQSVHQLYIGLDGLPTTNQPSIDILDGRGNVATLSYASIPFHPIPGEEGVKRQ